MVSLHFPDFDVCKIKFCLGKCGHYELVLLCCLYAFELQPTVFQDGSFNCDSKEIAENAMD